MPDERPGRFLIATLALGNFVVGLSILLPTGMLAELSLGLGVPIGTVGLLISAGAGVVCVSPPLVAWITSRIDRRTLLSSILLWLALGHVASAFAPNYASLLAIRLAMLAFAGAFTPLAAGTAALLVPESKRASTIASVLLGWALAIAIGLPLVTVTAPQIGWRATYSLIGILAALGFLALLAELPKQLKRGTRHFCDMAGGRPQSSIATAVVDHQSAGSRPTRRHRICRTIVNRAHGRDASRSCGGVPAFWGDDTRREYLCVSDCSSVGCVQNIRSFHNLHRHGRCVVGVRRRDISPDGGWSRDLGSRVCRRNRNAAGQVDCSGSGAGYGVGGNQ
jgi:hypothetical protein